MAWYEAWFKLFYHKLVITKISASYNNVKNYTEMLK